MKKLITTVLLIAITTIAFGKKSGVQFNLREYLEKNMKLIPGGEIETIAFADKGHSGRIEKIKVDSFFILSVEVSNWVYLNYLYDLKQNNKPEELIKALPDTLVWRTNHSYNEPYTQYYFRHPAYLDYPVVGVSYTQCLDFCKWLTGKYNVLVKKKYNKVEFDLPGEKEWCYAGSGGNSASPFPWGGPYLRNAKGQVLANYRYLNDAGMYRDTICGEHVYVSSGMGDYMGVAGYLNDAADITAPVMSYWPNNYGLYNMSGNVEEFVKEKGVSKGGSWRDPGYYLSLHSKEYYKEDQSASAERGFRVVMRVR